MIKTITTLIVTLLSVYSSAQDIPTKNTSKKELKTYLKSIQASQIIISDVNNYISFKSKNSKKWGVMRGDEIIVKPYYDSIGIIDAQSPYFIVKKDDKYSVVPAFYKSSMRCKYDQVAIIKGYNRYYSLISMKNKWGLYSPEYKFQIVDFDYTKKEDVPLFTIDDEMYNYILAVKTKYKAISFLVDEDNQDGIFIAKNNLNKWGMFQMEKEMVAMKHDSLGFYGVNASNCIIKNGGKYGALSSPWGQKPAEISIPCDHTMLKYVDGYSGMFASQRGDNWAYISSSNGDTLVPYMHKSFEELPAPTHQMIKYPMPVYPQKLLDLISNPSAVEHIDLTGLNLTTLPKEVFECVNATSANLEKNNLTSLPDEFFKLTKIKKLYLGGNPNFVVFDENFSKLINLEELYIGSINGSGIYTINQYATLSFDESMGQLTNLKTVSIEGSFRNSDIPNFIYNLPNLEYLNIASPSISQVFLPSFQKLKCKSSLKILRLGVLVNFISFNKYIGTFTKLESIYIESLTEKTQPKGILNVKNLKYCKVLYWTRNENSSSYSGKSVIDLRSGWGGMVSQPFTKQERIEALNDWSKFIKTVK